MASVKEPVHFFKLPDIATSSNQTVNNTPNNEVTKDIFVSNSHQGTVVTETHDGYPGNKPKFPKIILRDIVGRELDTDTSYQRAIYEAKWKASKGDGPSVPEEWRLPHGKIPARPDYSRTAPPVAIKRLYKQEMKKQRNKLYHSHPDFPEALETDKAYEPLRWSLQQTETLPALAGANLLNDFDRLPSRTYMPFVGMAPVINRPMEETDKREVEYVFPGFCYGCSKGTGLCYGCERDTRPHFHHDKPHRTGGGFSYFKRDKPLGEIASKNPANWRISLPAPRGLPPTAYVFYDDSEHPVDFKKYGVRLHVTQLPEGAQYPRDAFTATGSGADDHGVSRGSRREVTFITESGDSGLAITYPGGSPGDGSYRVDLGHLSSGMTYDQLLPTLEEYTLLDDDEEEESDEDGHLRTGPTSGKTKTTLTNESEKKPSLYKAPKPFQLKSKEKKVTIAVDPFSTDRQYDIHKGDGIHIKKSDKKLTDFDEFNFGDGTWDEPKQFEFKDRPDTVPPERKRTEVPEPPRKSKTTVEETKPKETKPVPPTREPLVKPKKEEKVKPRKETTPPKPKATDEKLKFSDHARKSDSALRVCSCANNVFPTNEKPAIRFLSHYDAIVSNYRAHTCRHQHSGIKNISGECQLPTQDKLMHKSAHQMSFSENFARHTVSMGKTSHRLNNGHSESRSKIKNTKGPILSSYDRNASPTRNESSLALNPIPNGHLLPIVTLHPIRDSAVGHTHPGFRPNEKLRSNPCRFAATTGANFDNKVPPIRERSRFPECPHVQTKERIVTGRDPEHDMDHNPSIPHQNHLIHEAQASPGQTTRDQSEGSRDMNHLHKRSDSFGDDKQDGLRHSIDRTAANETDAVAHSKKIWRLVVDELSPKLDATSISRWKSEPSVFQNGQSESDKMKGSTSYREGFTEVHDTESLENTPLKDMERTIAKKQITSNPRRVSTSRLQRTPPGELPIIPESSPAAPSSGDGSLTEGDDDSKAVRVQTASFQAHRTVESAKQRRDSIQKEEGVSLHPMVQQLDTPQVEPRSLETVIRLPSVGRASSNTTDRTLSMLHEPQSDVKPMTSWTHKEAEPEKIRLPVPEVKLPEIPVKAEVPAVEEELSESRPPSSEGSKVSKKEKAKTPPESAAKPKAVSPPTPEVEPEPETVVEEETPPTPTKTPTPPRQGKPEKKQRVVVKKERKQREPPVRKTRRDTDKEGVIEEDAEEEMVEQEETMSPEPEEEPEPEPVPEVPLIPVREKRKLPSPPPMRRVAPPPLPRAIPAVPPLPREYTDPDRPTREVSQTLLEAPPPMFEPPKQRRPPPMKKPKTKPREFRLPRVRTSETQSNKPELKEIMDPLDYLAKYCIIHKDRLPLYERVFRKVVKEQMYRYVDVPHDNPEQLGDDQSQSDTQGKPAPPMKTKLEDHEKKMINDLTIINRSTRGEFAKTGFNVGDQNVGKTHYILDTLIDKYEELQEKHDKLQGDRILLMAEIAKEKFPEVTKLNYKPKSKKKKGKKKKKVEPPPGEVMFDQSADVAVQTDAESSPRAPRRVTEVDIVSRLSKKMTEEINATAEVTQLNMEITRLQEKLRDVDDRIEDLEDEKKLLQLYSRDEFQHNITSDAKPEGFLRRQSALYRKMHEQNDEEMNVSELEEALQQINGHLISEKELQFIYHVLDIPGRRRINLQLFSVIAALSEKVKQVDPFIRKLINKFNYEALNVKMDRSKELFWLLDEKEDGVPSGKITSSSLALELAAGGVTPEHTQYVVNKFSRENKGIVDFMDYLTYVPLFIEIHGRIIDDPLSNDRLF